MSASDPGTGADPADGAGGAARAPGLLSTAQFASDAGRLARSAVVTLLASISVALLLATEVRALGYVLGAVALALSLIPDGPTANPRITFPLPQTLLAAGALAAYFETEPTASSVLLFVVAFLLLATMAVEPIIRVVGFVPPPVVANLPGFQARPLPLIGLPAVAIADALLVVATAVFAINAWSAAWLLLIVLLVDLVMLVMLADLVRLRLARRHEIHAAIKHVKELKPQFAVYFSGPVEAAYQLKMWLPYFERVGARYVIILREVAPFADIAASTSAPVLVCAKLTELDRMIVPSLEALLYVNNSSKNTHAVRFSQLTHIQLLHGDSDKPPSFSPVTAMYDRIFVAGQAGIDRYARKGVLIPAEKFDIVGRPQVEQIEPARGPIGDLTGKTVLYAPTWTGHYGDTDYCSLHVAEPILRGLFARGATVILRHHPYSSSNPASARHLARLGEVLAEDAKSSGRKHRWGPGVQDDLPLFDCFNLADALVADVSSVVSDFLFSTKPFAIVAIAGSGPAFVEEFPLASAAYVIEADLSNLDESLDAMLGDDPLADTRKRTRNYYLGDIDADHYADTFVEAVRRYL